MTIGFSTKWPDRMGDMAGQPNYFIEQIWAALIAKNMPLKLEDYVHFHNDHMDRFGTPMSDYDGMYIQPKIHTIRKDMHNRWRPGMKIHPVINNRTKDRFQFAPTLVCTGVQEVEIDYQLGQNKPMVIVDDMHFYNPMVGIDKAMDQLALNDGFPSVEAFFMWFNKDFKGKIIHWTDLRY